MQSLIILDKNKAIIRSNGKAYQDTKDNFLLDYGKEIPKMSVAQIVQSDDGNKIAIELQDISTIDYNRDVKSCWLNDHAFQAYPNGICEDILNSIDSLLEAKANREYVEPILSELKASKLTEVDAWTASKITGGFVSSASGEPVTYDSDKDTQLTMQGIALNVQTPLFAEKYPAGCPVRGYPEGSDVKDIFMLTADQVMQWCADLSMHIGECKQDGWVKQAEVEAATTKEELDAIVLD